MIFKTLNPYIKQFSPMNFGTNGFWITKILVLQALYILIIKVSRRWPEILYVACNILYIYWEPRARNTTVHTHTHTHTHAHAAVNVIKINILFLSIFVTWNWVQKRVWAVHCAAGAQFVYHINLLDLVIWAQFVYRINLLVWAILAQFVHCINLLDWVIWAQFVYRINYLG